MLSSVRCHDDTYGDCSRLSFCKISLQILVCVGLFQLHTESLRILLAFSECSCRSCWDGKENVRESSLQAVKMLCTSPENKTLRVCLYEPAVHRTRWSQIAQPRGDVTQIVQASGDVTQIAQPSGDVTQITQPSGDVTQIAQSSTRGPTSPLGRAVWVTSPQIAQPSGDVTQIAQSSTRGPTSPLGRAVWVTSPRTICMGM